MSPIQPPLLDLPAPQPAHPARYTDALLPVMASMLTELTDGARILDPFGGTGKIFLLNRDLPTAQIEAIELEPEWAAIHPRTGVGNALDLPWDDNYFDAIATSPAYGNRMADTLLDDYDRITYTSKLGRKLHPDNAGAMQWGDQYRDFHQRAWVEARRVLRPGGTFVLNIKDHIRAGVRQPVTAWHIATLEGLGFQVLRHEQIACPGMRFGAHSDLRIDYESVIQLRWENE